MVMKIHKSVEVLATGQCHREAPEKSFQKKGLG